MLVGSAPPAPGGLETGQTSRRNVVGIRMWRINCGAPTPGRVQQLRQPHGGLVTCPEHGTTHDVERGAEKQEEPANENQQHMPREYFDSGEEEVHA